MSNLNGLVVKRTDFDAFDVGNDDDTQVLRKVVQSIIHIRNQQRSGRKSLTTIAGLATDLDLLKILKFMKKKFSTNGTILKDEDGSEVLQLQGDRRREAAEFLAKYKVCEKNEIKIHGA